MAPPSITGHGLRPKASVESSLSYTGSINSNRSESTLNGGSSMRGSRSNLPPIQGSPAIRQAPSSSSLRTFDPTREIPSATPTKIPRIAASRAPPSPATQAMPPPNFTHSMSTSRSANMFNTSSVGSKTMTNTGSMADLARTGNGTLSEFGAVNGQSARGVVSNSHRAHLLAPMSTRPEAKRTDSKSREPLVRTQGGQAIPPSRRNLPIAPQSSATAMTVSAAAKRTSREAAVSNRPSNSRRSSKDTTPVNGQDDGPEDAQMKPSKSMHSKLVVPTGSSGRLPTSSSVGAAGMGLRKTSLVTESPAPSLSPADDEEATADAEMVAYVARRKARAKSGSKKDDLADIEEFPQDVDPAEPISQRGQFVVWLWD